jgi:hypothetical protein
MTGDQVSVKTYFPSPRLAAKVTVSLAALLSLFVVAAGVVSAGGWDEAAHFVVVLALAVVWLSSLAGYFSLAHRYGRLRLHIGPDGICRQQGDVLHLIPWGQVTRVRLQWFGNSPQAVDVYTTAGLALSLHEFAGLREIATAIQSQAGGGVAVEQMESPLDRATAFWLKSFAWSAVIVGFLCGTASILVGPLWLEARGLGWLVAVPGNLLFLAGFLLGAAVVLVVWIMAAVYWAWGVAVVRLLRGLPPGPGGKRKAAPRQS